MDGDGEITSIPYLAGRVFALEALVLSLATSHPRADAAATAVGHLQARRDLLAATTTPEDTLRALDDVIRLWSRRLAE